MDSPPGVSDQHQVLETADRVARAAYLWIRHGNAVEIHAPGRRGALDLVAGIIVGLCDELGLDERYALLSAYVYALIDGEVADALIVARAMLRRRDERPRRDAYLQGLRAANDLIALIDGPLDRAGAQVLPA